MWCSFLLLTLFVTVQGRAVNISNTWVLPEEGFPVFYRYFRDRISWYEADAVCQFHHANLVTGVVTVDFYKETDSNAIRINIMEQLVMVAVNNPIAKHCDYGKIPYCAKVDTTAQYDAVRAYLKELDISSAVWVGLIRSNPDGDFTWTDYRGLSGDGYWSSAPDARSAPLCAAADPTADYRWDARACGGPSVASFICELPVPQWALGNEGCMVRALPALTVLYLPESAAVQLTADCGLAGVKRVQCTGNVKRDELLKELSCGVEDLSIITTTSIMFDVTSEAVFTDQEQGNEGTTIEHDDNAYQSTTSKSIPIFQNSIIYGSDSSATKKMINTKSKLTLENSIVSDIIDNDNIHSNEINNIFINKNEGVKEQSEKNEDEKYLDHKKMHDELARLGNFETIFNQPSDHFVPPLVMAKAKIGDDMTVLSIDEKLAQQMADVHLTKYTRIQNDSANIDILNTTQVLSSTDISSSPNPLKLKLPSKIESLVSKNVSKSVNPKKYNNKYDIIKPKLLKNINLEQSKIQNDSKNFIETTTINKEIENTSILSKKQNNQDLIEDTSLELTVILKEPVTNDNYNNTQSVLSKNIKPTNIVLSNEDISTHRNQEMTDEVIKIIIVNRNQDSRTTPTEFEITTKTPVLSYSNLNSNDYVKTNSESTTLSEQSELSTTENLKMLKPQSSVEMATKATFINDENTNVISTNASLTDDNDVISNYTISKDMNDITITLISENTTYINKNEISYFLDKNDTYVETTIANITTDIDDFQSPLLSAANEPIHKPIRSRRPQASQHRVNKFNPFRILG